jgi:hypothetical protein
MATKYQPSTSVWIQNIVGPSELLGKAQENASANQARWRENGLI